VGARDRGGVELVVPRERDGDAAVEGRRHRLQLVGAAAAHDEGLHGGGGDDLVEVGAARPVGEVPDVLRVGRRTRTEAGVHVIVGEHADARLEAAGAEGGEHERCRCRLEPIGVDGGPVGVPDEGAVEEDGGQREPVGGEEPAGATGPPRRRGEEGDVARRELVDRPACEGRGRRGRCPRACRPDP
jgi:hypothetical protein